MDYIPLVTDDYRLAFCAVTASLPTDIQQIIYKKALNGGEVSAPSAPKKVTPSPRLSRMMEGWKRRKLY